MNVFMTGDLVLARKLFAEKQAFRVLERQAAENHLERLRSGRIESIQTSSLHLRHPARPESASIRTWPWSLSRSWKPRVN